MTIEKPQIKIARDRCNKPLAKWANPPGDGAEMYVDDLRMLANELFATALEIELIAQQEHRPSRVSE